MDDVLKAMLAIAFALMIGLVMSGGLVISERIAYERSGISCEYMDIKCIGDRMHTERRAAEEATKEQGK